MNLSSRKSSVQDLQILYFIEIENRAAQAPTKLQ
jgi:hypothetical protein